MKKKRAEPQPKKLPRYIEIILEFFPELTQEQAVLLLWERTPFPALSGEELNEAVRESMEAIRKARDGQFRLCSFCNNKAELGDPPYLCPSCYQTFQNISTCRSG